MLLIDISNILYSTHHYLTASNPTRTFEVHVQMLANNVLQQVLTLLVVQNPSHAVVALDDGTVPNFRRALYASYKAHRPPPPPAVLEAKPLILEMLRALGIPCLGVPTLEADDVIGTLTQRCVQTNLEAVIVSDDKDFFQLLQPNVSILRHAKFALRSQRRPSAHTQHVVVTQEDFTAHYGLRPHQWVDYLALCGDSSDNIPGVPGVGDKRAVALLTQRGSLEEAIQSSDGVKLPQKVRDMLHSEEGQHAARLSKALAQILLDSDHPEFSRTDVEHFALRMPEVAGEFAIQRAGELELWYLGDLMRQLLRRWRVAAA